MVSVCITNQQHILRLKSYTTVPQPNQDITKNSPRHNIENATEQNIVCVSRSEICNACQGPVRQQLGTVISVTCTKLPLFLQRSISPHSQIIGTADAAAYLMEKIHVDVCLCLPRLIICISKNTDRGYKQSWVKQEHVTVNRWLCTWSVFLKHNFGSFEEVFSNNEDFAPAFDRTAVQTLLENLRYSCRLSCENRSELPSGPQITMSLCTRTWPNIMFLLKWLQVYCLILIYDGLNWNLFFVHV